MAIFTLLEELPGKGPQKSILDISFEDLLEEAIIQSNDNPNVRYSIIDEYGNVIWPKH